MSSDSICIDFHTHEDALRTDSAPGGPSIFRIVSTPWSERLRPVGDRLRRTLELHPWNGEAWSAGFEHDARDARFVGIGEVGLDRNRGKLPLPEQLAIFKQAVRLADSLNKPLVLHCVGCFAELLETAKRQPWQVPTLLHYFHGKPALAEQLLRHENWFLSLPPAAVQSRALLEWLRKNPVRLERIVLETDDPAGDIVEHYRIMAGELGVTEAELTLRMNRQLEKIFGISL